jgi:hypothetical protein
MSMAELFSVNEAAAIAELSPDTIRTALEKRSVTPSHKQRVGKYVISFLLATFCLSSCWLNSLFL